MMPGSRRGAVVMLYNAMQSLCNEGIRKARDQNKEAGRHKQRLNAVQLQKQKAHYNVVLKICLRDNGAQLGYEKDGRRS